MTWPCLRCGTQNHDEREICAKPNCNTQKSQTVRQKAYSVEKIKKRKVEEEQTKEYQESAKRKKISKSKVSVNSISDKYQLSILDFFADRIHSWDGINDSRSTSVVVLCNDGELYFFTQRWRLGMQAEIDAIQMEYGVKINVVKSLPVHSHYNYHAECIAFQHWLLKSIRRIQAIGVSKDESVNFPV